MSSALSAWLQLNGFPSPFSKSSGSKVYRLKKALERVARVGARMPKLMVDETFIVDMCEAFLEDFHDVDVEALDPLNVVKTLEMYENTQTL